MPTPQVNRIPVKEITDCKTWSMPAIDNSRQVFSSAKKEDKQRKAAEKRRQQEVVGEEVDSRVLKGPMTAKQLQEITESAQQEGHAEGFKRGFEEGRSAGHQQGLDKGQEETEQLQARLTQLIGSLVDPYHSNSNSLEKILFTTVNHLVRSIVQRELMVDSGQVLSFVQQAVDALPAGSDNLKIFLNPDDIVLLENFKAATHINWELHSDPKLSAGGCRVETKQSLVDFSVEERLRLLLQRFANGEFVSDQSVDDEVDKKVGDEENEEESNSMGGEEQTDEILPEDRLVEKGSDDENGSPDSTHNPEA